MSKLPKDFAGWSENKLTLRDICDVTIDHKTPFGDATVQIQGIESPAGPVSNILIFFIMHLIEIAAYEHMAKLDISRISILAAIYLVAMNTILFLMRNIVS